MYSIKNYGLCIILELFTTDDNNGEQGETVHDTSTTTIEECTSSVGPIKQS